MEATVHPANRNSSTVHGSERCFCGAEKAAWALGCRQCWLKIPRRHRQRYFESTPRSVERRDALRTLLTALRNLPKSKAVQNKFVSSAV